jgi:HAD superfamily hydrolase (TIGR01509 family)
VPHASPATDAPRLRAIIFDLDGTLVDSRLDFAAMRRELSAPEGLGLLEYADSLRSAAARRAAMAVIHRHEVAGAQAATWMPGARETLHALHRRGTRTAIVTRNSRHAARLTMERLAMPPMPLKAREDAAPKPDPEALLCLADEWGLAPRDCAYVGDFRYDIEAAERAGMLPVLYVGSGEVPAEHAGAVTVLRDFAALHGWLVDTPTACP